MAGTVRNAKLESRTARSRLKRGRQPHWQAITPGRVHLGWQCWKGDSAGRWVLRRYVSRKYRVTTLGLADDAKVADGVKVLSFEQAEAKARAMVDIPHSRDSRLTVRQAMADYVDYLRKQGQSVNDVVSRSGAHILPLLGDLVVAELTTEQLRNWLATMAATPAQQRPSRAGKPQYRAAPTTDEAVRARRASANRVLTMLKGIAPDDVENGGAALLALSL